MANLVLVIVHFKMYKNFFESFENKCVDKLLSDSAVLCACLNIMDRFGYQAGYDEIY